MRSNPLKTLRSVLTYSSVIEDRLVRNLQGIKSARMMYPSYDTWYIDNIPDGLHLRINIAPNWRLPETDRIILSHMRVVLTQHTFVCFRGSLSVNIHIQSLYCTTS